MDGKHDNVSVPADGTEPPSRDDIRLYSIPDAGVVLGISESKVWRLVYADRLETRWIDGRRLVPAWAIDEFVKGLPSEKPDLAEASA